jgi:EAL domain-containing protein (putative c-di-GMP-specific phosphodiesterase class I)
MAGSERDTAVVRSANEIGHLLGLKTVAADVDGAAELDSIRKIGFDYAQGRAVAEIQRLSAAQWP